MENKELKLQDIKGAQKAAIFLLSMGENYTANIFKTLDEISIKKLEGICLKLTMSALMS